MTKIRSIYVGLGLSFILSQTDTKVGEYMPTYFFCLLLKFKFDIFFAPQNITKPASKVAHIPTRPPVFSPESFCFVKLRQF